MNNLNPLINICHVSVITLLVIDLFVWIQLQPSISDNRYMYVYMEWMQTSGYVFLWYCDRMF